MKKCFDVDFLEFQNLAGIKGFFQFLLSVWNVHASRIIKKKIIEFKPDVVHVHNWHYATGPIVFRTVKKMGVPVIHTLHNYRIICPSATLMYRNRLYIDSIKREFPWNAVLKKVYRNSYLQTFYLAFTVWFHRKKGTWNSIDKFICLTQASIQLFHKAPIHIPMNRIAVKPNFIDPVQVNANVKRGSHFLYVGRLSSEKGIELLIKAFEGTDFELRIAGDGPLREYVKTAALHSKIKYLGKLNTNALMEEYLSAKALIFPSIWYEPFGMTIIEAYSCGLPVIASNIGASIELVKDGITGFLFTAGDIANLKLALKKMNTIAEIDYKKIQEQAINAHRLNFSPEKQVDYFTNIYSSVLYGKKKGSVNFYSNQGL